MEKNKPKSDKNKPDDKGTVYPSAKLRIKDVTDGKEKIIVDKRG